MTEKSLKNDSLKKIFLTIYKCYFFCDMYVATQTVWLCTKQIFVANSSKFKLI